MGVEKEEENLVEARKARDPRMAGQPSAVPVRAHGPGVAVGSAGRESMHLLQHAWSSTPVASAFHFCSAVP